MRLLDARTGEFFSINDPEEARYAILSHVWSKEGEQSFQDLQRIQAEVHAARELDPTLPADAILRRASPKIREACAYALADGFDYIWIDSCCIDKTSSAELSEAINSMYSWYGQSIVCYAFLHDVSDDGRQRQVTSQLRRSAWFTRGWTLQELIAPRIVTFVSAGWRRLGDKDGMSRVIREITGIDEEVLNHLLPLSSVSVARRMSWASKRVTTRKEDEAYSLMGIFGVNMPTIYGEGRHAFFRLQEEILKHIPDQSIFTWNLHLPVPLPPRVCRFDHGCLFAVSPAWFMDCQTVQSISLDDLGRRLRLTIPPPMHVMTSHGVRTAVPLIPITSGFHLAILACQDIVGKLYCLMLAGDRRRVLEPIGVAGIEMDVLADLAKWYRPRLRPFALQRWYCMRLTHGRRRAYLTACGDLEVAEVYISRGPQLKTRDDLPPLFLQVSRPAPPTRALRTLHPPSLRSSDSDRSDALLGSFYDVQIAKRCTRQLNRQGYDVSWRVGGDDLAATHAFTLTKPRSATIEIRVAPCGCVPRETRLDLLSKLAVALSVSVTTSSSTFYSNAAPVMFKGVAFSESIPVEHDWNHPCHHDATGVERSTWTCNMYSCQRFSSCFFESQKTFLKVTLDQDCPGSANYPARFTLAIDLISEPHVPASRPTLMRWYLLGPVPRVSHEGEASEETKKSTLSIVDRTAVQGSVPMVPGTDLLVSRLCAIRDQLSVPERPSETSGRRTE